MSQKTKAYNHLLCSFCLAITILTSLFTAFEIAFQPPPAAARTLTGYSLASNRLDPAPAIASPPSFFIQATRIATYYLPLIFKNPQPLFWDDFSDDKSGWPIGQDSSCTSAYDGGRFRLTVDNDEECFRFAPPAKAERVFGTFEVSLYHSEGPSSDAFLGLYFNGDGGSKQYIFRIRPNVSTSTCPNGGQWELRRRWIESNGNKRDDLIHRTCEAQMKRGYGSENINTIRAKHTNTGQIILHINNKQVLLFNESSDSAPELTGQGTGLYARAPSDKDIVVKYDDFKVYTLANSP